jgi:hypothetical protein
MIKLALTLAAVLALNITAATAHHKPGHNPPGHQKYNKDGFALRFVVPLTMEGEVMVRNGGEEYDPLIVERVPHSKSDPFDGVFDRDQAMVGDEAFAMDLDWRSYRETDFNFEIELPLGLFEPADDDGKGLRLRESGGLGLLDVYGAVNSQSLAPDDFAAMLERDDQIGKVTYRASGRDWFVLSGFYSRDVAADEHMIFYSKFMFSADHERFSAFEISYPPSDKQRFDDIVARLEQTLTAPL